MESWRRLSSLAVLLLMAAGQVESQLRTDFYASTCPDVESIVREEVRKKFVQTFVTVPATLRLFFHDCFVEGCDASVIIASPNGDAEKDADENISLAGDGFDTVIKAKTAVESRCPGVVSCADILALATRDVVVLSGGPSFTVELGRLDGLISQRSRVAGKLPKPDQSLDQLNAIFKQNNLTETDVIILSGAHTLGFAHCGTFSDRLYSNPDPTLNADFARQLQDACPRNVDPLVAINLDVNTPRTFDNVFFSNLVEGKGLLRSDQVLFSDPRSRSKVVEFAGNAAGFGAAFADAMVRLGRVGVKTGSGGEIRRDCAAFN